MDKTEYLEELYGGEYYTIKRLEREAIELDNAVKDHLKACRLNPYSIRWE